MMRPVFITTLVIISATIVKVYDLVVALTNGGPGISSEVPAKYVYDLMFSRGNLGQGLAASTIMLTTVLIILVPWALWNSGPGIAKEKPRNELILPSVEPRGSRPKRFLSPTSIMIYGAPCCRDLLPRSPLCDGHDFTEGHARDPARQYLLPAGRAHLATLGEGLDQACTGLDCEGIASASSIR